MSGLNNNEFRLHQFSVEVCDIIRQIPAGKVLTYGQIARLAGFSNYSRWVAIVSNGNKAHKINTYNFNIIQYTSLQMNDLIEFIVRNHPRKVYFHLLSPSNYHFGPISPHSPRHR